MAGVASWKSPETFGSYGLSTISQADLTSMTNQSVFDAQRAGATVHYEVVPGTGGSMRPVAYHPDGRVQNL